MSGRLDQYRLFWREFRQTFETTGAVAPSGRALCRELARHVTGNGQPRRVLEVGPGTGVVTDQIIARLGPEDTLDLVELNDRFVELLRQRLAEEPSWQAVAERVQIHHKPVQDLSAETPYDAIVSGLPLNNFPADLVAEILAKLHELAADGATLSFFEYVAVRKAKALVSRGDQRRRLLGIETHISNARKQWGCGRRCILANLPPAWVHHLRFGG
ncbi:MAG: phospholipid methyltransferase [Planctomycetaceae bacterium]|nr:phospholipid methyltransferase [Planctomycetaceae bacterium]